ncbi:MAG: hypothetical protein PHG71_00475, partial [Kiritimatiellae bacterium]|nr:hypothetical protein [Kiritimatiellia bacterium]MDD4621690.1 hypothetical protein [Kiritimatiellia bacterium]
GLGLRLGKMETFRNRNLARNRNRSNTVTNLFSPGTPGGGLVSKFVRQTCGASVSKSTALFRIISSIRKGVVYDGI